jgi:hypothetical protein
VAIGVVTGSTGRSGGLLGWRSTGTASARRLVIAWALGDVVHRDATDDHKVARDLGNRPGIVVLAREDAAVDKQLSSLPAST